MESIHPLKAFRAEQKPPLSQQALADLLEVDRVTVTRWEAGKRKIDQDKLPLVSARTGIAAAALRPDLAQLFEGRLKRRRPKNDRRSRAA